MFAFYSCYFLGVPCLGSPLGTGLANVTFSIEADQLREQDSWLLFEGVILYADRNSCKIDYLKYRPQLA